MRYHASSLLWLQSPFGSIVQFDVEGRVLSTATIQRQRLNSLEIEDGRTALQQ